MTPNNSFHEPLTVSGPLARFHADVQNMTRGTIVQTDSRDNCMAVLKAEYTARTARNAAYSLRAFARDLGMSPSRLSELFNGKHGLSAKRAAELARRLGFSPDEVARFSDMAEAAFGRSEVNRKAAELRLTARAPGGSANPIDLDAFAVISQWYHLAIVELAQMKGFDSDPLWIARKLGIGTLEVKIAIDRLLRYGLLERSGDQLVPVHARNNVGKGVPSEAIRTFHMQLLDRAQAAILSQPFDQRGASATILAVPRGAVLEANVLIREFRQRFSEAMTRYGDKEQLYCLAVQFFSLEGDDDGGQSSSSGA
jgi:uncharacterized protein (TIGR02147 family)